MSYYYPYYRYTSIAIQLPQLPRSRKCAQEIPGCRRTCCFQSCILSCPSPIQDRG